jgi:hypothetical protein
MTIVNPNLPGACGQKRTECDKHNELFHINSWVLSMESHVVTNPLRLWVLGTRNFGVYGEMLVRSVRWRTEWGCVEAGPLNPPSLVYSELGVFAARLV